MDTATLARAITNVALLDTAPVPLVDLPPLDLPPLRTHERFMAEHDFWTWLAESQAPITDDELRRFRRRERDRERREAKR